MSLLPQPNSGTLLLQYMRFWKFVHPCQYYPQKPAACFHHFLLFISCFDVSEFFDVDILRKHSEQAFLYFQVGAIPANAVDDGQWSQGLISAVSFSPKGLSKSSLKLLGKYLTLNALDSSGPNGCCSNQQPVWGSQLGSAGTCQRGEAHLVRQASGSIHRSAAGGLQGQGRPGLPDHEEASGQHCMLMSIKVTHTHTHLLLFVKCNVLLLWYFRTLYLVLC